MKLDAKVVAAIEDMCREELLDLFHTTGTPYDHSERTATLREYMRHEYSRGNLRNDQVLAVYNGGL